MVCYMTSISLQDAETLRLRWHADPSLFRRFTGDESFLEPHETRPSVSRDGTDVDENDRDQEDPVATLTSGDRARKSGSKI